MQDFFLRCGIMCCRQQKTVYMQTLNTSLGELHGPLILHNSLPLSQSTMIFKAFQFTINLIPF